MDFDSAGWFTAYHMSNERKKRMKKKKKKTDMKMLVNGQLRFIFLLLPYTHTQKGLLKINLP